MILGHGFLEEDTDADVDANADAKVDPNVDANVDANGDAKVDAKVDGDVDADVEGGTGKAIQQQQQQWMVTYARKSLFTPAGRFDCLFAVEAGVVGAVNRMRVLVRELSGLGDEGVEGGLVGDLFAVRQE